MKNILINYFKKLIIKIYIINFNILGFFKSELLKKNSLKKIMTFLRKRIEIINFKPGCFSDV